MIMIKTLKAAWKSNKCGTKNMRFKQVVLSKYQNYCGWCCSVEAKPKTLKAWLNWDA